MWGATYIYIYRERERSIYRYMYAVGSLSMPEAGPSESSAAAVDLRQGTGAVTSASAPRVVPWALGMGPLDSGGVSSMGPILKVVYSWYILGARLGAHTGGP